VGPVGRSGGGISKESLGITTTVADRDDVKRVPADSLGDGSSVGVEVTIAGSLDESGSAGGGGSGGRPTMRKKGCKRERRKTQGITLPADVFTVLNSLDLCIPQSIADIPGVVEALKEKQRFFEELLSTATPCPSISSTQGSFLSLASISELALADPSTLAPGRRSAISLERTLSEVSFISSSAVDCPYLLSSPQSSSRAPSSLNVSNSCGGIFISFSQAEEHGGDGSDDDEDADDVYEDVRAEPQSEASAATFHGMFVRTPSSSDADLCRAGPRRSRSLSLLRRSMDVVTDDCSVVSNMHAVPNAYQINGTTRSGGTNRAKRRLPETRSGRAISMNELSSRCVQSACPGIPGNIPVMTRFPVVVAKSECGECASISSLQISANHEKSMTSPALTVPLKSDRAAPAPSGSMGLQSAEQEVNDFDDLFVTFSGTCTMIPETPPRHSDTEDGDGIIHEQRQESAAIDVLARAAASNAKNAHSNTFRNDSLNCTGSVSDDAVGGQRRILIESSETTGITVSEAAQPERRRWETQGTTKPPVQQPRPLLHRRSSSDSGRGSLLRF
jgi:hypothetical protein